MCIRDSLHPHGAGHDGLAHGRHAHVIGTERAEHADLGGRLVAGTEEAEMCIRDRYGEGPMFISIGYRPHKDIVRGGSQATAAAALPAV